MQLKSPGHLVSILEILNREVALTSSEKIWKQKKKRIKRYKWPNN